MKIINLQSEFENGEKKDILILISEIFDFCKWKEVVDLLEHFNNCHTKILVEKSSDFSSEHMLKIKRYFDSSVQVKDGKEASSITEKIQSLFTSQNSMNLEELNLTLENMKEA